jgi:uncharacterized protein with beta-barrel porin domain
MSCGGQVGARLRRLLTSSSVAALLVGSGAPSAFAVSPCAEPTSGPYSNSGSINCIFITNGTISPRMSFSGAITNTSKGSISTASMNGITIGVSTFSGAISNAGTISAWNVGIEIANAAVAGGGISNSGTISAGLSGGGGLSAVAIVVTATTSFSGGITNTGSVSGAGGIYSIGVSTFLGGITNSGTISSPNGGIRVATGAVFGSTSSGGGIINSGTINAANSGIGVFSITRFAGGISNSGTISAGQNGIALSNITQFGSASAGGGIVNTGTITATHLYGIEVVQVTTFLGGITNSASISAAGAEGIYVYGGSIFSGGIVNFGTITTAYQNGIEVYNGTTFSGGISNAGTISAVEDGIRVLGQTTFLGGISNSGTISAGSNGIQLTNITRFGSASIGGGITNTGTISAANSTGLYIQGVGTFDGGIGNAGAGTISGGYNGIQLATITQFGSASIGGGISNSGMISGGINAGIQLSGGTFFGGISNSGMISGGKYGIQLSNIAQFGSTSAGGGISNSGTISGGIDGIYVANVSTFSGGISNSGTISGVTGIVVTSSGAVSVFDSGTITGSGGTAVNLSGNAAGNTFTLGPGFVINGNVLGSGSDTFQLGGSGNGTFNLATIGAAAQYRGFTTFNVASGIWTVSNTFGQAQTWNVNGGTLAGTGTLPGVIVNSGGTLEPGTIGVPGTSMTITGNLTLKPGSYYLVTFNPSTSTFATVGSASLAGTLEIDLLPGTYSAKTVYTILDPPSISGTFSNVIVEQPGFKFNVAYAPTGITGTVTATLGAGSQLSGDQQNLANAINNSFNNGATLPAGLSSIFGLSGGNLANALTQLSGEAATGAEESAFQLTNEFLNLMLDPFVNGRGYAPGATGGSGGALGFAPDEQTSLPSDVALAYASILGKAPPQSFDQRWSAWGAAFGGSSTTSGDPTVGSHDITAGTYGFAAGMDYHVTPSTIVGFALAGAGTNWGLANGLGGGYSEALQVGTYGISWFGRAYLAGALSFSNHWFTTNRAALGDQLTANFAGQSYGARFEGGYRVPVWRAFGVTPYGAVQAQDFQTPSYSESDTTGGGFGLSYNAMNATDVRTELGARFDDPTLLYGKPLILFGRLAWAHDFVSNPALSAAFEALPGSTFTVNGAPIPQNSALTSVGAQLFVTSSWSLLAKFDGEFASGAQTYGGSGTLRYTW